MSNNSFAQAVEMYGIDLLAFLGVLGVLGGSMDFL